MSIWRSRTRWLARAPFLLSIAMAMTACGGGAAPAPSDAASAPAVAAKGQLQVGAAGFDIVDPTKFPEPAETATGGIPKADLEATPKRGGTLRVTHSWIRMDPHFPNVPASERFLARMFANGLLKWDLKTNAPALDLAESWQVAPDNLSYTVKIRKGVKFQNVPPVNGRELTAEDVKWSLDRVSGLVRQPGQASFNYARFETLKEVQIVDNLTIRLVLKQPDNMFLRELMYEFSVILPKEAAIDGQFNDGKSLIGTGPFIVELGQVEALNRFKRNPDYFDKGPQNKPYLDAVESHFLSAAAIRAAFTAKQVDWISASFVNAKPFFNDPQVRITSGRGNIVGISGISLNPNVPPTNDIRVRRAIHLGIDREEYVLLVHGGPEGGYGPGFIGGYWQPWFWSEENLRSLPGWRSNKEEDYAEARKLLAEAGYASGLTITCECENAREADVIVQQLKRVGITVNLNIVPSAVVRHLSYMRDKPMSSTTQGGLHTPDGAIVQTFLCDAAKNMPAVCDQEIERMWREFRREFNPEKAVKLLDQMQQRLYDLMVYAPGVRVTNHQVAYKYVRGWRNPFYDLTWVHSNEIPDVWLDK